MGVIGDEDLIRSSPLAAIPGVAEVVAVQPAFKLASRTAHPEPSIVSVGKGETAAKFGGGHVGMIAGPCAIESADRLDEIAEQVAGKPQKIEIRGHASRKPVQGQNHYDLAYLRASRTRDYLVERGIDAERIRVGSAGKFEPLDDRLDEASRKRNARVEVLMWDEPVTRTR